MKYAYDGVILMIKILIADDHALLREGIRRVLSYEDDLEVVGEAEDGEDAIKQTQKLMPDILLLDINMPVKNGIEVAKELSSKKVSIKIIALTIHDGDNYILELLKNGALGYILKDVEPDVLIHAIHVVNGGNAYVYPKIAERIGANGEGSVEKTRLLCKKHRPAGITAREMDVLSCIGEGLSNQEIADRLCVSEKTVKNHLTSIFKKLGVTDRTQALVYVLKNKILSIG